MLKKIYLLSCSVAVMATLVAAPAHGQETDSSDTAGNVSDIVVTARKRAESLQNVPLSISVLSGQKLQEQNLGSIENLQSVTAGLVIRKTPNNTINLTLRGLGTGTAIDAFEQSVATFVDGTYAGRGPEFNSALFDFDRVEVIRGAQASLLSKNTSLGAISLTTRKPGDDFAIDVIGTHDFELGSNTIEAGMDIPLSETVKMRVAAKFDDQHGYIHNDFYDNDTPRTRNLGIRGTLVFTPTDALDVTLTYQYFRVRQRGLPWEIVSDPNGNARRLAALAGYPNVEFTANRQQVDGSATDPQSYDHTEGNRVIGTVNYELGSGHTLTSVTSYSDFDSNRFRDTDLLPGDYINTYYNQGNRQFQQEFRLTSPADGQFLDYVIGAAYFREKWLYSDDITAQCIGCPSTGPNAVTGQPGLFNLLGHFTTQDTQRTRDLAGFAQVNMHLTDQLTLSGGIRYTNEKRSAILARQTVTPGALTAVIYKPFAASQLSRRENNVDGSIGVNWKANDALMLYASFSKGTKGGGFNNTTAEAATPAGAAATVYNKEKAETFEIGEKLTLPGGGFFNVSLFQTDIKGFQQATFNGSAFVITGEDLRARGFEAEAGVRLLPGLRLQGQVSYADTKRKPLGLRPPGAPKWSGNVNLNLNQPLNDDLTFNGDLGVEFRSGLYLANEENTIGFPGRPGNVVPYSNGYGYLNARVAIAGKAGWEAALIGRNLTNKDVLEYSVTQTFVSNGAYVIMNKPRTIALQLSYRY